VQRFSLLILLLVIATSCTDEVHTHRIISSGEEPQDQIVQTISKVVNGSLSEDSLLVIDGTGSSSNIDSIKKGVADFAIIDNHSAYDPAINSVAPLYPQILHIVYKKSIGKPEMIEDLIRGRKVYAQVEGSGAYRFVELMKRAYGIRDSEMTYVQDYEFFEAEVIFSFSDLLSYEETRDIKVDYNLFSIDDVDNYGKGSIAEGLSVRFPEFRPYIIPKEAYGNFTEKPVLTLAVDALLVCRKDMDQDLIYQVAKALNENKEELNEINPLLAHFTTDFDEELLRYKIHPGSRNYMERYEPTFLEKYAEVGSVIISIFVALASLLYSVSKWQKAKKKNKIDVFYNQLMAVRAEASDIVTPEDAERLLASVRNIQAETIALVTREKLMADESFSIFLNLSKIITDEIIAKKQLWINTSY